jgi:type I restriction enzyme S subunit
MSKWKEVKLNTVTSYIKRGISPKYVETDGFIVINQKCIRDNRVTYKDSKLLNKAQKIVKEKYLQDGDILVNSTGTGTLGRVAQYKEINESIFCDSHVSIVRANKLIDKKFLAHQLSHKEPMIENYGKGATNQRELSTDDLGLLKINLPPLPVQQKIAKILSNYDDLIENNLKRIKLLEESARLTYEEWFLRFRIDGKKLDINPESGLPFGWKKNKNGNVCNVSGGGTPSKSKDEYWSNGNINWFSPTDLSNATSLCVLSSNTKTNKLGISKSSAKLLNSNSFMMSSRATIGLFGLVEDNFSTNQGFINITPYRNKDKYYLLHNFMFRVKEFKNYATGTTFFEISKGKFKPLSIVWPMESVIDNFNDVCMPIYSKIFNLTNQNQLLKEARDILMPRLMTGMIDTDKLKVAV